MKPDEIKLNFPNKYEDYNHNLLMNCLKDMDDFR